jgi:hypothetical protein
VRAVLQAAAAATGGAVRGDAVRGADFIIDDTFEDTDVATGKQRSSFRLFCRRMGFPSVEALRAFNGRLADALPDAGVDRGVPSRRGLVKLPGCCKKSKGARWQFPNPTLETAPPVHLATDAQRRVVPYAEAVPWEALWAQRLWWETDAAAQREVVWWAQALPQPVASRPPAASRPLPHAATERPVHDTPAEAAFAYILEHERAIPGCEQARYYSGNMNVEARGTLSRCIAQHHQCAPGQFHHHNNVRVRIDPASGTFSFWCLHPACPQHRRPHPGKTGTLPAALRF